MGIECKYPTLFGLSLVCLLFVLASITTCVVLLNRSYNSTPHTTWVLVGGLSSSSAELRIRSGGVFLSVREASNDNDDTNVPVFETFVEEPQEDEFISAVTVNGLLPNTKYIYTTTLGGTADGGSETLALGSFSTPQPEGTRFNFSFVAAGCSWTASTDQIFETMKRHDPLFFLQLGDFHYEDIGDNDMEERVRAFDLTLGSDTQRSLLSDVPLVYMYDDHDWLGNDSGSEEEEVGARETALRSYQLAVPHYPLVNNDTSSGVYHAFTIGTVRFLVSDLRSESTNSSMYSIEQRNWLLSELSQSNQYDFVIWATTKPWIGEAKEGEDSWFGAAADREELSEFISNLGIENLLTISSDAHMLAFDDGRNTYYGKEKVNATSEIRSFPILQTGPLDRLGSTKGGPFSEGCYTTQYERNHQYSLVEFIDSNAEGGPCLAITAYRANTEVFSKRLCGDIFASATGSASGSGSCEMESLTVGTYVLLGLGGFLCITVSLTFFYCLSALRALCTSVIVWFFYILTVGMSLTIPLSRDVAQFDIFPIALIGLIQMVVIQIYCIVWFLPGQKEKTNEDENARIAVRRASGNSEGFAP